MRKIIIIPSFANSHLLKCSLTNWIDILEPDVIIINESIFPFGPENKKEIDANFRKKWCYKDTNAGFDYDETLEFITELTKQRFEGNKKIPHIESRVIDYKKNDANECFLEAISNGLDLLVTEGTIVFPLEPDVLFHEDDKEIIQEEISRLKPSQGLKCMWRDFLETQYYCEAINEVNPKVRRFCYCFDNFQNYKTAMDGFMTQNYPLLEYTNKFWARHYPWFVYDKWKELRYELIYRKDPQYWKDFESGLQYIRHESKCYSGYYFEDGKYYKCRRIVAYNKEDKILIRPSRHDEARWAKFIDISHPKHIHSHPNFVK